jgi:predicted nucleic acid-binding protein
MTVEAGILDANVLVYALDADASQYNASRTLVEEALHSTTTLYVTSQILCEFYSVVTNAKRVTTACSPGEALKALSALLAFPGIRVLPAPVSVIAGWMALLGAIR